MSAEPKRVELTKAERASLDVGGMFPSTYGWEHPEKWARVTGASLFERVARIVAAREAAARREALQEVRRSVAVIRTPLNNLVGLSRAQAFHVGVGEVATLLDNTLLAEPERDPAHWAPALGLAAMRGVTVRRKA